MKKFIVLLIVSLICFAACSNSKEPQNEIVSASEEASERVVLYGEIKEVIGNMLTVDLIDRSNPMREMTEEEMEEMRSMMEGLEIPEGMIRSSRGDAGEGFSQQIEERIERIVSELPEGFESIGGMRIGEAPFGGAEDGFPMNIFGGRNYTGESKDIIIPAGAPIMENSIGENGFTESEISLDKLKAGDIIEVTYASDGETVSKVVKQPSMTGFNRGPSTIRGDFTEGSGPTTTRGN